MRILFLALGDARRRAIIDEATEVIRANGTAAILMTSRGKWEDDTIPEGVEIVEITSMERDHLPIRLERGLVFTVPRKLSKAAGRGPLRRPMRRAWKSYERRLAKPVHRRFMNKYKSIWSDRRRRVVTTYAAAGRFDYVNVTDYLSMQAGAWIAEDLDAKICFGIEYIK